MLLLLTSQYFTHAIVCVCMFVRMGAFIFVSVCVCAHMCMCVCVHVCVFVNMGAFIFVPVSAWMCSVSVSYLSLTSRKQADQTRRFTNLNSPSIITHPINNSYYCYNNYN